MNGKPGLPIEDFRAAPQEFSASVVRQVGLSLRKVEARLDALEQSARRTRDDSSHEFERIDIEKGQMLAHLASVENNVAKLVQRDEKHDQQFVALQASIAEQSTAKDIERLKAWMSGGAKIIGAGAALVSAFAFFEPVIRLVVKSLLGL